MDLGLADKNVVVTGGASNIGRATSLLLAEEGANVVIADIDADQAQLVAKVNLGPGQILVRETDVTDKESVEGLYDFMLNELGPVYGVANVLGWDRGEKFVKTTPDFWDRVIALNYTSVLNMTHTFLPGMLLARSGALVHVASDAGRVGEYREAVYGGTKAAVINFSKSIAREAGPEGIRSNVVCPGMVIPESEDDFGRFSMHATTARRGEVISDEAIERAKKLYALRRLGEPIDIARAIAFLMSDVAAGHITGQTLSVSGGYTMV